MSKEDSKIIDINYGKKKYLEIDVERMVRRILRSYGEPMVTVELKKECIEEMIEDAIEIFMKRLEEAIYDEARAEAGITLRNIRGKFKGEKSITGAELTTNVE